MEKSRVNSESVDKYFTALVDLKNVLKYTTRVSLNGFCEENQLSKNLPSVLQKGGIIKCNTKGKYSEWEWTTIEPTKQMALKTIQLLGEANPPRKAKKITPIIIEKSKNYGGARVGSGRKTIIKEIELTTKKSIDVRLFFGLFSFTINI